MLSKSDWTPPEEFDEYRIVQPLGRGGIGYVFLAHDRLLDRFVAVKFIPAIDAMPEFRERLLIEARAAARVQHPNIASIYRVGELGWKPYIISEFVPGQPLDKIARPLAWARVLELGIFLTRGLAAAHRNGVLHRDIKPGNAILAEDGSVKLVDFGLAKLTDEEGGRPSIPPSGCVQKPFDLSETPLRGFSEPRDKRPSLPAPPVNTNQTIMSIPDTPDASGTSAGQSESQSKRSLTPSGEVMGTPLYMAPELWRGEPSTRRSDIYSLGVVLFELCAGQPPHYEARARELRRARTEDDAPALVSVVQGVDPTFAAIVDRCLRRDPAERFASADELLESLAQLVPSAGSAAIPAGNPYRGLHSFEAEHRALFFGRSAEMRAVIERLRLERFVLVAGDSGTGKSSLCRAGVLPLVEDGALQQGRKWSVVALVPGARPLAGIATALAPALNLADDAALAAEMARAPEIVCKNLQVALGRTQGLVLFVDQIEELLTLSDWNEASHAAQFLARLAISVQAVRLLATVRGDFLTRLARLPGLGADLARAIYVLRPLSPERVREAIVGPAQATGIRFESEAMIDTLVQSTARADGALPLLQFALAELWEARDQQHQSIPASALDAIGGVEGALARHADGVLMALLPEQRAAARRILVRLVTADGTRARRTEGELALDAAARAALEALVRGRLIAVRQTEGGTSYEVAHEALIGGWSTLKGWLDAQAEGRAARQRLETAAAEWQRLERIREALWSARQLAEVQSLDESELSPEEADFLRASRRAVQGTRRVRSILFAAIPAFIALLYGGIELKTKRDLQAKVAVHLKEAHLALDQARDKAALVERIRGEAFSLFDERKLELAERHWAKAVRIAEETSYAYARAGRAFEAALVLDGTQHQARELFADILYERALLAERDHQPLNLDEFLSRLPLYDDDAKRRSRWNAPASITISTVPVVAQVSMERFVLRDGRMVPAESTVLGTTPIAGVHLAPGSYILRFSADGHADVRYPLYLQRGEQLSLTTELVAKGKIPAGFIYIPAGRFLFGTSLDDRTRLGFLNALPVHEVKTEPYLIAQRETTYLEWIEFLNTLPPREREKRLPRVGSPGASQSIALVEQPGGKWLLRFQPAAAAYTLLAGEKIRYRNRNTRVEQDWMQMPVSGISSDDVNAYAAWLQATGRVPGARMCTEHEWERAARGADLREFPHGDTLEPDDANYLITYGKDTQAIGPDEVGSHSATRSPFGVDDMTGNVWEWTRSSLSETGYVIRGGGYYYSELSVRTTNRELFEPMLRHTNVGARFCATWPTR